jgi:SAM-dependent methyltransferase
MNNTLNYDKDYGASIDKLWVPAPRFSLRRRRILQLTKSLPKGKILEIGSGSAALLREFSLRDYQCTGYDTSADTYNVAILMTQDRSNIEIVDKDNQNWENEFDYLLSCEVLEHIVDDQAALIKWANYLKPKGMAILTVPCHMRKFGPLDSWAGHIRRYERDEFEILLDKAGFDIVYFEVYGYPLANITSFLRNKMLYKSEKSRSYKNKNIDTANSGIQRKIESKLYHYQKNIIGRMVMRVSFALQFLFRKTELGDGFIILAKKR